MMTNDYDFDENGTTSSRQENEMLLGKSLVSYYNSWIEDIAQAHGEFPITKVRCGIQQKKAFIQTPYSNALCYERLSQCKSMGRCNKRLFRLHSKNVSKLDQGKILVETQRSMYGYA